MANLTEEDFIAMAKILKDTCLEMAACDRCPFEDHTDTRDPLMPCLIHGRPYGWRLDELGRGNEE